MVKYSMLLLVLHPEESTDIKTYANMLGIPFHRKSVSSLSIKFLDLTVTPEKIINFRNVRDYIGGTEKFRWYISIDRFDETNEVILPSSELVICTDFGETTLKIRKCRYANLPA